MKFTAIAGFLVLAAITCRADDAPPGLKAIEARYNQTDLANNEAIREKYIMELAKLRWRLVQENKPGWQAVDAEIEHHPAPADSDGKAFLKTLVGVWHSPRHDYRYRADYTWVMADDPNDPAATNGTWSIRGNQYSDKDASGTETTYTIILLDAENFIFTEPGSPDLFFQVRSLDGGLPIRR